MAVRVEYSRQPSHAFAPENGRAVYVRETEPLLRTNVRPVLAILATIVIINIVIRYPYAGNLQGVDTFYETGLAQSVNQFGRMAWLTDASSYFGYPATQPPAVPALLSVISQTTGLGLTASNYFFTSILAIVGTLGAFCLALKVRKDYAFAILVSIVFSLAPRFMSLTVNQSSTRHLFVAVTPIAFLCLLCALRTSRHRWTWITLFEVFALMLVSAHHVGIFLVPAAVSVAASYPVSALLNRIHIPRWVRSPVFAVLFLGLLVTEILHLLPSSLLLQDQYYSGRLFTGQSVLIVLANITIDFGSGLGALCPLAIVGLVYVLHRPQLRPREVFPILLLLGLAPALVIGFYTFLILMAPLAILVGFGARPLGVSFSAPWRRKATAFAVATALTGASAIFMLGLWGFGARGLSPEITDVATFMRLEPAGVFLSNDIYVQSYQIWTFSGRPPLSPSTDLARIYSMVPTDQIEGLDLRSVWGTIQHGSIADPGTQHLLMQLHVNEYVDVAAVPDTSTFRQSLTYSAYAIFDNGAYVVWQV